MPRKMIIVRDDGQMSTLLTETEVENELQLQEQLKQTPDLLPVDEWGMTGPLLVIGRETQLASGAADLLAIARSGELLIIEFKTGPQNADFRRVLAQLIDYGAALWQITYEELEETVARPFFASAHCTDRTFRGTTSLEHAAQLLWPDRSEEERARFGERLREQLRTGSFHYVVVAQRFLPTSERAITYLNAALSLARFYAVELVRFAADAASAFEARTVLKPSVATAPSAASLTNEATFLANLSDDAYRHALQQVFDACRRLGLRCEWGARGTSIRIQTAERGEPFSIGWLYPPGTIGWMGLSDLTLGYDASSLKAWPDLARTFEVYVEKVGALPGVTQARPAWLRGYRLGPDVVIVHSEQIVAVLADLVRSINGEA